MAGSRMRRSASALAASALLATACADSAGSDDAQDVRHAGRAAFAAGLAEAVVVPSYAAFADQSGALVAAARSWDGRTSGPELEALHSEWRSAALLWQRAELYQFGPAGAMSLVAGGEDLRDLVYSWPIDNPCRVDQELVDGTFASGVGDFAVNVRGLDALEYLLFGDPSVNACSPNSRINAEGTWDALGEAGRATRRAAYALALAEQLQTDAEDLVRWWSTDGEDFLAELRNAGAGSDTYASEREALNALTDALFYIEKETKDMKLAVPVGLIDCEAGACPEAVESAYANASLAHIRANLEGFAAVFEGSDTTPGFANLLADLGASELAERMQSETQRALDAINAIDAPLDEAVLSERDAVLALHDAISALVRDLKTQFVTTLDVEIPQRAEGDND